MNDREEIDYYQSLWDQSQKHFPKEDEPARKDNSNAFFGFIHNVDPYADEEVGETEAENWNDVYYRAMEISGEMSDEDRLVTEEAEKPKPKKKDAPKPKKKAKPVEDDEDDDDAPEVDDEEGFGKDLTGPGKDVKFNVNPTHFASKGQDNKMRVTPNWTDGDELRELARLKSMMYDLESEMLGTDIRGGDPKPIQAKLKKIIKQVENLSQKLIPDPRTDVS